MSGETYQKYQNCPKHEFTFHLPADITGGALAGNTVYICKKCSAIITLVEKCALDQNVAQEKSLRIQERHTRIGMWANIIAAATLIIAFLTLLFGDKLIK